MTHAQESAIFGAVEANMATIDALPDDSLERESYVSGLADGVRFALTGAGF